MTVQPFQARNGLVVNANILVVNTSTNRVGVNTAAPNVSFQVVGVDAISLPSGNTGQRPTGANAYMRYNTDNAAFEGYANGVWGSIGGASNPGGPNGSVQFNNSGTLGGSANLVFDGTSFLFVPNITSYGNTSLAIYFPGGNGAILLANSGEGFLAINSALAVATWDSNGFCTRKQRAQSIPSVNGGTTNIDFANGNIITISMTGNTAMGIPSNFQSGFYTMIVVQDATGNRNITSWNSVFKWPGATVPQQTLSANAKDVYSFVCDGTNVYGTFLPAFG